MSNTKKLAAKQFGKTLLSLFLAELLLFWSIDASTVVAYADTIEVELPTVQAQTQATSDATEAESESADADVPDLYTLTANALGADVALASDTATSGDIIDGLFAWPQGGDSYSEYHYRDAYFYQPSSKYNSSLATMSMCLAMSAFNAAAGGDDYSHKYVNLENLLTEIGFKDLVVNQGFKEKPTRSSIGVGIASKDFTDEDGTETTLIAIAIRGGGYGAEWASNVSIGTENEAGGFSNARDQVVTLLNEYLRTHEIKNNPKFWIVGFSRASATANLTANYLNYCMENPGLGSEDSMVGTTASYLAELQAQEDDLYCYGFEVPAGGTDDTLYPTKYQGNIWCLVNEDDVVPLVAPKVWGFFRYGTDVSTTEGVTQEEFLEQLSYVSPGSETSWVKRKIVADGGFRMYWTGLIPIVSKLAFGTAPYFQVEDTADYYNGITNMSDYINELIDYTADVMESRTSYGNNLQPTIAAFTNVMFTADSSQMSTLVSVASSAATKDLSIVSMASKVVTAELGDPLGSIPIFGPIIDAFTSTPEEARMWLLETITGMLDAAYDAIEQDSRVCDLFSEKEYKEMHDGSWFMACFVYKFIFKNYHEAKWGAQLVGTALYYSAEIIDTHMQEPTLSYLRAKDINYTSTVATGRHRLTLSDAAGLAAEDVAVDVVLLDRESGEVLDTVATVTSDGLSFAADEYEASYQNKIKLTATADGAQVITVDYALEEGCTTKFVVRLEEGASNANVYLNYLNIDLKNTGREDPEQYFENTSIPLTPESTLDIFLDDSDSRAIAVKNIPISVKYMQYDSSATGKYVEITDASVLPATTLTCNGMDVSSTGTICSGSTYALISTDTSDELDPFMIYTVNYDSDGSMALNEDGMYSFNYKTSATKSTEGEETTVTAAWYFTPGIYDTSYSYVITCVPAGSINTVTLTRKLVDDDGQEVSSKENLFDTSIENLSVIEDADQTTLTVSTGDTIRVKAVSSDSQSVYSATQYRFIKWILANEITDVHFTDGSLSCPSFTFTMPDHDVDFTLLTVKSGSTYENLKTITTTSAWAVDEVGTTSTGQRSTPANLGWATLYEDSSCTDVSAKFYYGTATHVYELLSDYTKSNTYAYLKAPEYTRDESGNILKFDHWAVYTSDAEHCFSGYLCAQELVNYGTEEEPQYVPSGDAYCPDGSTNPLLCISGTSLQYSLICVPIYEPITYNYTVTLTDGSTVTGSAASGEVVTVENVLPDEWVLDKWTANYTYAKYKEDAYGNTYQYASKLRDMDITDETNNTLSFVMHTGDTVITAESHQKTYDLTIESGGSVPDGTSSFVKGATVTVKPAVAAGQQIDKWVAVSEDGTEEDLSIVANYNDDGQIESYSFTMPGNDLTIKAITSEKTCSLTYEGKSATFITTEDTDYDGGTLETYTGQTVLLVPDEPEVGYTYAGWDLVASDSSARISYTEMSNGILTLSMPDCDVQATPLYEKVVSGELGQVFSVAFECNALTGGTQLPAYATTTNVGLISKQVAIDWTASGAEATGYAVAGTEYTGSMLLKTDDAYEFTSDLTVTINGNTATVAPLNDGSGMVRVSFTMTADAGEAPTGQTYTLTVQGGAGSGTYVADANSVVSVCAYASILGTSFQRLEIKATQPISFIDYHTGDMGATFVMPACDVTIIAHYRVDTISLSCDLPAYGESFAQTAEVLDDTPVVVDQAVSGGTGTVSVTFYDKSGTAMTGDATASCEAYRGSIRLTTANAAEYCFGGNCTATVNGEEANVWVSGDSVLVSFDATAAHQFDAETGVCADCGAVAQVYDSMVPGKTFYEVTYTPAQEITKGCATYQGQDMIWVSEQNCWVALVSTEPEDLNTAFSENTSGTKVEIPGRTDEGSLYGDVSGNGVLNIVDAQVAYDLATGCYALTADNLSEYAVMLLTADVDNNHAVDAADARAIQYAVMRGWGTAE